MLSLPDDAFPAAILCIGHVDDFYPEPLLKMEGWDKERKLEELVYENSWFTPSNLATSD